MKRYIAILFACLISLWALPCFAYTPPASPAPNGYVVDQAGKLSTEEVKNLNQTIRDITKDKKNQYGILILSSLDGESIDDVAIETGRAWGIGNKNDNNGILIVLAIADRKSRIEVGRGLQGELTDIQSSHILKDTLAPHLKKGEFYLGLTDTVNEINKTLDSRAGSTDPTKAKTSGDNGSGNTLIAVLVMLGIFGGIVLVVSFIARRKGSSYNPGPSYSSPTYDYTPSYSLSTYTPSYSSNSSKVAKSSYKPSSSYSSTSSSSSSSSSYDSGSGGSSSYDSGSSFGGSSGFDGGGADSSW
jgi:uncharacterized protein